MAKQGNWIRQQAIQQESREREKSRREALGKLFHDFAKLSFAGLVIGGMTPIYTDFYYESNTPFIIWGLMLSFALAFVGDRFYKK